MTEFVNHPTIDAVLDVGFSCAVLTIATRLFPAGFDVSENAPSTFEALKSYVLRYGRMCVWNGASERTIFSSTEVNWAFRAWHDHCHLRNRDGVFDPVNAVHDFTPAGEAGACRQQVVDLLKLCGDSDRTRYWKRIVEAEVIGQAAYFRETGKFSASQSAFVRRYLAATT